MVVPDAPRIRGLEHLWEKSASDRLSCEMGRYGAARDGGRRRHGGIDFEARFEPVGAAMAGRVTFAGRSTSSRTGNLVVIDHGHGVKTYYAHLDSISVRNGDTVDRETQIGISGKTGTKSPHLHYEVRVGGKSVPPDALIDPKGGALTSTVAHSSAGRRVAGANGPKAPSLESVYRIPVPTAAVVLSTRQPRANPAPVRTDDRSTTEKASTGGVETGGDSVRTHFVKLVNWIADWVDGVGLSSIASAIRTAAAEFAISKPADPGREVKETAPRKETGAVIVQVNDAPLASRAREAGISGAPSGKRAVTAADIGRSMFDDLSM